MRPPQARLSWLLVLGVLMLTRGQAREDPIPQQDDVTLVVLKKGT